MEERKAYVAQKQAQRRAIQEKMKKLSDERDKFLVAERKKIAAEKGVTPFAFQIETDETLRFIR